MSHNTPEKLLYSIPEAREITGGICNTSAFQLIADGHWVAVKLGRRTLVTADSVRSYAASLPRATINMAPRLKRAA